VPPVWNLTPSRMWKVHTSPASLAWPVCRQRGDKLLRLLPIVPTQSFVDVGHEGAAGCVVHRGRVEGHGVGAVEGDKGIRVLKLRVNDFLSWFSRLWLECVGKNDARASQMIFGTMGSSLLLPHASAACTPLRGRSAQQLYNRLTGTATGTCRALIHRKKTEPPVSRGLGCEGGVN
jgi:hypothetical protein